MKKILGTLCVCVKGAKNLKTNRTICQRMLDGQIVIDQLKFYIF